MSGEESSISSSRYSSSCSTCSHSSNSSSLSDRTDESEEENDKKLYDYELDPEADTYFDKYDHDINSNCCKLTAACGNNLEYAADFNHLARRANPFGSHQHQVYLHSQPDIDTIIKSISSVESIAPMSIRRDTLATSFNTNSKSNLACLKQHQHQQRQASTTPNKYKSANHLIYEKLNKQRLELVDLLLKHGADKYLVTKLSISNLERLDKKSFGILKKWYGTAKASRPRTPKDRQMFTLDASGQEDDEVAYDDKTSDDSDQIRGRHFDEESSCVDENNEYDENGRRSIRKRYFGGENLKILYNYFLKSK